NDMRHGIINYLDMEIAEAKAGRKAHVILKVNSLSDKEIIKKLYDAAQAGVSIEMIVRSIYCATNQPQFKKPIHAISIVDEYLEHSRFFNFYHAGKEHIYISSFDLMMRHLDYRIEAEVRIGDKTIKKELLDMLRIQLNGHVQARVLDNHLQNKYVRNDEAVTRAQIETYRYLKSLGGPSTE